MASPSSRTNNHTKTSISSSPSTSAFGALLTTARKEERTALIAQLQIDEEKAAELKAQLDVLQREYDAVSRDIWQKKYSLAAVGMLPPEVMGEVFEFVAADNELSALTMSHVCRAWRRMIQSTPRAWSTIHIRLTRRDPAALAALFFEQARACPLHVIISDPPPQWKYDPPANKIEPFVGLLKQHWNHIRIFRVYRMGGRVAHAFLQGCIPAPSDLDSPDVSSDSASSSVWSSPAPSLSLTSSHSKPIARHVALNLHPNHAYDAESDMADFRSMDALFGDAPNVTTFCLENGVPSYDLPLFYGGKLKSIQIDEPHVYSYTTPVDKVLDILAASPELHVFVLAGNKSQRDETVLVPRPAPIKLPMLRILSLQSMDLPFIMDHLVVPSLEKLKLGNELAARWDGSIATSLRGMITRSGVPPITRLRINEITPPNVASAEDEHWWCFGALPHLQSFRCHHTLFPDHVLDSLCEVANPNPKNEAQAQASPQAGSGAGKNPPRVLCPKLSKLVFENCTFSGEALVRFVKARTHGGARERKAAELQELWVGQCDKLEREHTDELKRLMGRKFQPSLLAGDA
ncbi:hypothetical protein FRB90_002841 [Tulasnella sp. 427]|nr:hypothetical protein FRB90_002841 [Tulasnella sp. 427]